MPAAPQSSSGSSENVLVPFEHVAGMVRHLSHDIRNRLNTLGLQSATVQELTADAEVLTEIQRLRGMIKSTTEMLREFSASFSVSRSNLANHGARIFVEDFRAHLATLLPEQAPQVIWTDALPDVKVPVDLGQMFRALSEFFKNAFQFREKDRPISARAAIVDGRFILEIIEGKSTLPSPPDTWGREPFLSTRYDGYGLGLFHARRVLAEHQGEITFTYDAAAELLTTRITLPLVAD